MKKRKDCFFGLHFDLHASPNTDVFGAEFDENALEHMLKEVKPDYVQCDTKGHAGYATYLTNVGTRTQIHSDILKKWREITAKHGVLLYAHYSGVFDSAASKAHPEWAAVNENGEVTEMMSLFGDYADKLLIPQLKELALCYGLNGAWIDGDCWCAIADYSKAAAAAYKAATGRDLPKSEDKEAFRKYQDFCRLAFFAYADRYVREVKCAAPDFEITSNWLNSAHTPDDINITDFISGDLTPTSCIDSARFDGRVIADYSRPWDIMSWGFSFYDHTKTITQLSQEAACIISLGGAFQLYHMQGDRKTFRRSWLTPILKGIAEFCRERQAVCHGAKPVPEAAVIFSREAHYTAFLDKEKIFLPTGPYIEGLKGVVGALLDNQISTETVLTHNALVRDLSVYALIAVSDTETIEPELYKKLVDYAKGGGALVICGADTAKIFADELGIKINKKITENPVLQIREGVLQCNVVGSAYAEVDICGDAEVLETMEKYEVIPTPYTEYSPKTPYVGLLPSVLRKKIGEGTITALLFDFGQAYHKERSVQMRELFASVSVRAKLKLKVKGSCYVDVALMTKNGREYIHLTNTAGEHRAAKVKTFSEIPPLYDICVSYCCPHPKKVTLLPENKEVDFKYSDGILSFLVNKLEIHTAAEIIYGK